jgi:hypothetical protein
MAKPTVPCNVVGCGAHTRIAWAAHEAGRQIWFMVCPDHHERLKAGEPYVLASRPFDLHDPDAGRFSLIMQRD